MSKELKLYFTRSWIKAVGRKWLEKTYPGVEIVVVPAKIPTTSKPRKQSK